MPSTKWPIKYKWSHHRLIPVLTVGHLVPAGLQDSHLVVISLIWFKGLLPGRGGGPRGSLGTEKGGVCLTVCGNGSFPPCEGLAISALIRLQSCHRLDLDYSQKADMLKYLVSYLAIWKSSELQVGPTGAGKSPKG